MLRPILQVLKIFFLCFIAWLTVVLTIEVKRGFQIGCYPHDLVAYTFELLVFFKRNLFRHRIGVGSECFASALVPQIIQLSNSLIACYHPYDLVNQFLGVLIKVSVHFFAFVFGQLLRKKLKLQHDFRIVFDCSAADFFYDLFHTRTERKLDIIPRLCLLFVNRN